MVPTSPYPPTPAVMPGPEPGTVFRTWSGLVRAWMTLLALAMTVLLAFLTLVAVGTVVLDASRATGECVITRSYPLLGEHKETHPLAAVQGTTLLRRSSRGRTSFAVALRLPQGDVALSPQYARTGRDRQQRAIDAFLADPGAPRLHLVYDPGNPLACLMLLGLPLLAWYLVVVWQRAILRVEDWRGAVVLVRTRWPLAPWIRTFPREQVLSARVAENARRRQRSYRVELVLALGNPMPLLSPWGSDLGRCRDAAARINAALAR